MNDIYARLAYAYIELAEAVDHKQQFVDHSIAIKPDDDSQVVANRKPDFGPSDPCNLDRLSFEDEMERELRALCAEVNKAYQYGVLPRRGYDLARWLGSVLLVLNVEEFRPDLVKEVEALVAEQTYRIESCVDRLRGRADAGQLDRIVERLEHVETTVPVAVAAKLVSQFYDFHLTTEELRRKAKKTFGTSGVKNGEVHVDLVKALNAYKPGRDLGEGEDAA